MGQFNKVCTMGESLEHISVFNPSTNPISPVEAAVDDSLIQADTEREKFIKTERLPTASSPLHAGRDEIP